MRIRKRWHPHQPNLLSSTLTHPAVTSQKSPANHHIIQSAAPEGKKFVSLLRYDHSTLYPNKVQRPLDPPPPVLVSCRINASFLSNQLNLAEIGVLGEKEITITTDKKIMTTAVNKSVYSYGSSSTTSAETSAASAVSSSLSHHGWHEEDKAFPLKKRRIILERFIDKEEHNKKKNVITKSPMRTKRDGDKIWASSSGNETNNAKKREYKVEISSAGAPIEESMRCTRTNGMRWRCSKRKLEGYAWCKHHVNSARAMKGVEYCRNRGLRRSIGKPENVKKYWRGLKEAVDHDDDAGRRDFKVGKKRKRVMISSILDRTVPLVAAVDTY